MIRAFSTALAFGLSICGLSVAHVLRLYLIARRRGLRDFPKDWRP